MKIISLFSIGVGAALFSATVLTSRAADPGLTPLRGHVPAAAAHLQARGRLPATTDLKLAIGLPLRNPEALTNLLQQIYDPSSPNYHQYLTPDEFTAQFGPTESNYQAVIDFAKASGLTVTATHSNRMVVDVSGKVANVEKAFHVTMHSYKHPREARDFFAPDTEPSVPNGLRIQHVSGLENYSLPHPGTIYQKPYKAGSPGTGSGLHGAFIGSDFRNAYVPGSANLGSGQYVGLLQFDGYFPSDIATYETLAGLTNVPLQNVLLDGFSGSPGVDNDEVCMDIEMVVSMAPALAGVVVFEGYFPDDILSAMAANNQIKQLSSSWFLPMTRRRSSFSSNLPSRGNPFSTRPETVMPGSGRRCHAG